MRMAFQNLKKLPENFKLMKSRNYKSTITTCLQPSLICLRLAQENPLLYAELACKPNGLQEYVDAMNEFN